MLHSSSLFFHECFQHCHLFLYCPSFLFLQSIFSTNVIHLLRLIFIVRSLSNVATSTLINFFIIAKHTESYRFLSHCLNTNVISLITCTPYDDHSLSDNRISITIRNYIYVKSNYVQNCTNETNINFYLINFIDQCANVNLITNEMKRIEADVKIFKNGGTLHAG